MSNPKYNLLLGLDKLIYWKIPQNSIEAFGFKYKDDIKWFHAASDQLLILYNMLSCKCFFGNIKSIYDSQTLLGTGASSKVYKVVNKLTGKIYASKCIRKDYIFKRIDKERYVSHNNYQN